MDKSTLKVISYWTGNYVMEDPYILDLNENKNKWIIGTPDAVDKLEFYSEQVQVKNNKVNGEDEKQRLIAKETFHRHALPIKEYCLVLTGTLKVKVENEEHEVNRMNLLVVRHSKCHKVSDCSSDVEYLTIRAPASDDFTKMDCKESSSTVKQLINDNIKIDNIKDEVLGVYAHISRMYKNV